MARIIDSDDIAMLLGVTFTQEEEDVVDQLIEFAVGEVEAYLGRPVEIRKFTDDVYPNADGRVYLPQTPVREIISVHSGSNLIDPTGYEVATWGLNALYAPLNDIVLADPYDGYLRVVYEAGLDAPAAVNSLIANGVIRKWNERSVDLTVSSTTGSHIRQVTVEDYSYKLDTGSTNNYTAYAATANPITIFRSEKDFLTIRRFRKRMVG